MLQLLLIKLDCSCSDNGVNVVNHVVGLSILHVKKQIVQWSVTGYLMPSQLPVNHCKCNSSHPKQKAQITANSMCHFTLKDDRKTNEDEWTRMTEMEQAETQAVGEDCKAVFQPTPGLIRRPLVLWDSHRRYLIVLGRHHTNDKWHNTRDRNLLW